MTGVIHVSWLPRVNPDNEQTSLRWEKKENERCCASYSIQKGIRGIHEPREPSTRCLTVDANQNRFYAYFSKQKNNQNANHGWGITGESQQQDIMV